MSKDERAMWVLAWALAMLVGTFLAMPPEYGLHLVGGGVFAATGAWARHWCEHRGWRGAAHKVGVGALLVAVETVVLVGTVG